MKKRPVYLIVIALLLIAWGVVWLSVYTLQLAGNPNLRLLIAQSVRVMILYIDTYLFLIICILCGIGLFRGYRWTRFLFVGYGIVHFGIMFVNRPLFLFLNAKTLIPIAIFLAISGALFFPEKKEAPHDKPVNKTFFEDKQRLKDLKPLGVCITVLPIFYVALMTAAGASFPFDILQGNMERVLFEPVPFLNVFVIFVCSIPATIYFYGRFEQKYRNPAFLVIIGLVVAILYFFILCLLTMVFIGILFMTAGTM